MGLLDRYWGQQRWGGRVVVGCERDTPTDYERPGLAIAPRSPGVGLSRMQEPPVEDGREVQLAVAVLVEQDSDMVPVVTLH